MAKPPFMPRQAIPSLLVVASTYPVSRLGAGTIEPGARFDTPHVKLFEDSAERKAGLILDADAQTAESTLEAMLSLMLSIADEIRRSEFELTEVVLGNRHLVNEPGKAEQNFRNLGHELAMLKQDELQATDFNSLGELSEGYWVHLSDRKPEAMPNRNASSQLLTLHIGKKPKRPLTSMGLLKRISGMEK